MMSLSRVRLQKKGRVVCARAEIPLVQLVDRDTDDRLGSRTHRDADCGLPPSGRSSLYQY